MNEEEREAAAAKQSILGPDRERKKLTGPKIDPAASSLSLSLGFMAQLLIIKIQRNNKLGPMNPKNGESECQPLYRFLSLTKWTTHTKDREERNLVVVHLM